MEKKKILLIGLVIVVVFIVLQFLPISFYLPHEKPVLILPVAPEYDNIVGVMPMGEKMEHPNTPLGHPGIDFGMRNITENIPYIASMDGTISKVEILDNPDFGKDEGKKMLSQKVANVVIQNGPYQNVYTELDGSTLPAHIKVGREIKQGDVVGYGNFNEAMGMRGQMIHWEFGSTSPLIDRFCPLTYFTEESRTRIEIMWNRTEQHEMYSRYPLICNGGYEGKVER